MSQTSSPTAGEIIARLDLARVQVELLPLDRDRRREFLARWFGRRDGTLVYDRAEAELETERDLRRVQSLRRLM